MEQDKKRARRSGREGGGSTSSSPAAKLAVGLLLRTTTTACVSNGACGVVCVSVCVQRVQCVCVCVLFGQDGYGCRYICTSAVRRNYSWERKDRAHLGPADGGRQGQALFCSAISMYPITVAAPVGRIE